jgi:lipopolysaccharide/colanic/teichoic acid biosynthesis glycosyltransferase
MKSYLLKEYDWTKLEELKLMIDVVPKLNFYITYVKGTIDFLIALTIAVCVFPLYLIIFFIMKCTMPGPIFFLQERIGYLGKTFSIYKFRTMRIDGEAIKTADASKDEERITCFGKILRRLKLDETPQIFNVLKGEMAIVGPRPTIKRAILEHDIDARRLSVKPGLTGLAQVRGNTALDWQDRVTYDLQYIDSLSFINDVKIIAKTAWVILVGEDKFANFHHHDDRQAGERK